jgi:chromosome partitioning protein
MPDILATASQKSGVSKTTPAVSLSAHRAKMGRRALVVVTDSQANCTTHFGVESDVPRRRPYHLLTEPESELQPVILDVRPNLTSEHYC